MKHARKDYNRFQEPKKLIDIICALLDIVPVDTKWRQIRDIANNAVIEYSENYANCVLIPEDEPVFMLRASDKLAVRTLEHYNDLHAESYVDVMFQTNLSEAINNFAKWSRSKATAQPSLFDVNFDVAASPPPLIPLQADVTAWTRSVFTTATPFSAMERIRQELDELSEALVSGAPKEAVESEVADVAHVLLDLCAMLGVNIDTATRKKLAVNKARNWSEPDENNQRYHVKE